MIALNPWHHEKDNKLAFFSARTYLGKIMLVVELFLDYHSVVGGRAKVEEEAKPLSAGVGRKISVVSIHHWRSASFFT
jgi:hypothetical protein